MGIKPARIIATPVCLAMLAAAQVLGQGARVQQPARPVDLTPPRYIVLATDVSSSMNDNDPRLPREGGPPQALRDDGQMTFLQLLPLLYSNTYVGVVQFSNQVTWASDITGKAALREWRRSTVTREELDELVHPIVPHDNQGTKLNVAMDWARQKIEAARKLHGDGEGMLILLTDGDPDSATLELSLLKAGGKGDVITATDSLAGARISAHPVFINKGGWKPEERPKAKALMDLVAQRAHGRCYEVLTESDWMDVFNDLLKIPDGGSQVITRLEVSEHHRTLVLVGMPVERIEIKAAGGAAAAVPLVLPMGEGIDPVTGIDRHVVRMAKWDVIVLRRPADLPRIARSWAGQWSILPRGSATAYRGRAYLISDFLLDVGADPSPCWSYENVLVKVTRRERPKDTIEGDKAVPPLSGNDLDLHLQIRPADGGKPEKIKEGGSWDPEGKVYLSAPLQLTGRLALPGKYLVDVECYDRVGELRIPLGTYSGSFEVQPSPVTLRLRRAAQGGGPLLEIRGSQGPKVIAEGKGREEIIAELEFGADAVPSGAILKLPGVTPEQWTFKKTGQGWAAGPIALPESAAQLPGHAEVMIKGAQRDRILRLPEFRLPVDMPPLRQELIAGRRECLYVREIFAGTVSMRATPVAQNDLAKTLAAFPTELNGAALKAKGKPDGFDPVPVRGRLVGEPKSGLIGEGRYEVLVTYALEAKEPIPPCTLCELDLGEVLPGVASARAVYPVQPPPLDSCEVFQDAPAAPNQVAPALFIGEPVHCRASWQASQPVSSLKLVVKLFAPAGAEEVSLPVAREGLKAEATTALPAGAIPGQQGRIEAALALAGQDGKLEVRLLAGHFRVQERILVIRDPRFVLPAGTELTGHAFERLTVTMRITLDGYRPGKREHEKQLEQFRQSAVLRVVPPAADGKQPEPVGAEALKIEWKEPARPGGAAGASTDFVYEGFAVYRPGRVGRYRLEFTGQDHNSAGNAIPLEQAILPLAVREPRVVLEVDGAEAGAGPRRLFNGLARPPSAPIQTELAAALELSLRRADPEPGAASKAWKFNVVVNRIIEGETVSPPSLSRQVALASDGSPHREPALALTEPGEYEVRVTPAGAEPDVPGFELATGVLLAIAGGDKLVPDPAPSQRLTRATRYWPFGYRIAWKPEWPTQPGDLYFEFKLPGATKWLRGAAAPDDQDAPKWLRVSNSFLEPTPDLRSGPVQCRLRLSTDPSDRAVKSWKSKLVMVVDAAVDRPRLEDVRLENARREWKPNCPLTVPVEIDAQPKFKRVPELEGVWKRQKTVLLVCSRPRDDLPPGPLPTDVLKKIIENRGSADPRWACYELEEDRRNIIIQAGMPSRSLWWPWSADLEYAVVTCIFYTSQNAQPASKPAFQAGGQFFVECTHVEHMTLEVPWRVPWLSFCIGCVVILAGAALLARPWVPDPEELGVGVAILPDGYNTPGEFLDEKGYYFTMLKTSRWPRMGLYIKYWRRRNPAATRVGRMLRAGFGAVVAVLRWLFLREALVGIVSRGTADSESSQVGLVRVSTSLWRKAGDVWLMERTRSRLEWEGNDPLEPIMSLSSGQADEPISIPIRLSRTPAKREAGQTQAAGTA